MSEADLLIYADSSEFDLLTSDTDTESENSTVEEVQETLKPTDSERETNEHNDDDIPRLEIQGNQRNRWRNRKRARQISSSSNSETSNDKDNDTNSDDQIQDDQDQENQDDQDQEDQDDQVQDFNLNDVEQGDEYRIPSNDIHLTDSEEDSTNEMDIKTVAEIFKKKLKKYGISQRMAANLKNILKCSQSTVSGLYVKADRLKTSKDLSARGREPYELMEKWLKSEAAQKETKKNVTQQRAYGTTPVKPRSRAKKAVKFSSVQLAVLVKLYQKDSRPSVQKKELIAETLNLDLSIINTWFNNQRARNFPAGKEQLSNIPDELDMFVNNYT